MSAYRAFASVYDLLTDNVDYRQRAEKICSLLCHYGKGSGILLDAGCGTGNFSELFSEKGYDVIGVDLSVDMLCEAQRKKTEKGLDILYLNQDMTDLDLYGTVDCAVCLLDGINHLPGEEALQAAFRSIGFFMEKDGIFIFDVNTEYKHRCVLGDQTFVYDLPQVYCVWRNQYDSAEMRTDIRLDLFFPEGDGFIRQREEFSEWFYSDEQIQTGLHNANFEILTCFAEESETTKDKNSQRQYYVCRKTKDQ